MPLCPDCCNDASQALQLQGARSDSGLEAKHVKFEVELELELKLSVESGSGDREGAEVDSEFLPRSILVTRSPGI